MVCKTNLFNESIPTGDKHLKQGWKILYRGDTNGTRNIRILALNNVLSHFKCFTQYVYDILCQFPTFKSQLSYVTGVIITSPISSWLCWWEKYMSFAPFHLFVSCVIWRCGARIISSQNLLILWQDIIY